MKLWIAAGESGLSRPPQADLPALRIARAPSRPRRPLAALWPPYDRGGRCPSDALPRLCFPTLPSRFIGSPAPCPCAASSTARANGAQPSWKVTIGC